MPKGPINNDVNLNIRLNNELMDAIRQQAGKEKLKASAMVRRVLIDYLVDNKHKRMDLLSPREIDHVEIGNVIQKGSFLE